MQSKLTLSILIGRLLKQIWPKFKKKIYLITIITFLASCLEVLTLFILLKFLSILIPQEVEKFNKFLIFGINLNTSYLALYLLLISLFSAFLRSYSFYLNTQIASKIGTYLVIKGYANALTRPYIEHISSDITTIVTKLSFAGTFIGGFLFPFFQSISSIFLVTFIIISLLIFTGKITIILCLIAGLFYFLVTKITNEKIKLASQIVPIYSKKELKLIKDSFYSIKNIKLDNNHLFFIEIFKKLNIFHRNTEAISFTFASIPRFWVEAFSICVITISTLVLVNELGSAKAILIVAVIALGAQRLMPAIQTLYGSFATMRSNKYAVEALLSLQKENHSLKTNDLKLDKKFKNISFNSLSFSYKNKTNIIKNFNFKIQNGEKIGICGLSGSGKSTILDILMGLIEPTEGTINIDGKLIKSKYKKNERNPLLNLSSHVPQECFLMNTTIVENIAFGMPKDQINFKLVKESAKLAEIDEFIDSLPNKYNNIVGDNGQKLSGGQKQRLAIARAIYKQKPLLVFDEATSSLDNITENNIIKNVFNKFPNMSIIVVAHRLSSLQSCDNIYVINEGSIYETGKYLDLIKKEGLFFKMLKASNLKK